MIRRLIATCFLFVLSMQVVAKEVNSAIYAPFPRTDKALLQGRFDVDPTLHSAWIHHITNIDFKTSKITLDDGSVWQLGSWYSQVLRKWAVGDQVTVSWCEDTYFLDTRIKNYTKKSYAWVDLKEGPQAGASGFVYIDSILNGSTLILSNGVYVYSKKPWMFSQFKPGDVVITLYGKMARTKSLYALWDVSRGYIAYNLRLNSAAVKSA